MGLGQHRQLPMDLGQHRQLPTAADKIPGMHFLCLPAMSTTSNSGGALGLSEDEQILHHHAAMIKKDLEAFNAISRSQEDWIDVFKNHLVCFTPCNLLP